jgi:flagellar basal body-associated protein FliL
LLSSTSPSVIIVIIITIIIVIIIIIIIIIIFIILIILCSGGFPLYFGQPVGEGLADAVGAIPGPVPSLSETRHRATQARRLGEVLAKGDAIIINIVNNHHRHHS